MADAARIVGGTALTIIGAKTGQGWLAAIGINLASSGLSGMLREDDGKKINFTEEWGGWTTSNVSASSAPIPVIYGTARVAPRTVDQRVDPGSAFDRDLAWVGAICVGSENGGGIQAIDSVWFDGALAISGAVFESEPSTTGVQAAFSGKLEYGAHAGTDAQTVDAELHSRFATAWPTTSEGAGIACLANFMTFDEGVYPTGVPTVLVQVQGQIVYDLRTPAWAHRDNPALCILDYLTSKRYGVGALYSERDGGSVSEIDEASFIAAANYFDEVVSAPSGNQKRFTCNGILNTSRSHRQNLDLLVSSCRSDLIYQGGKFRLVPRKTESAQSFEITEANILGSIEITVGGLRDAGNVASATFVDAGALYQVGEVTWPESDQANTMLTNDNDWEHRLAIDLPFTNDLYMAQQLVMTYLRESRQDVICTLRTTEEALKLQVGEVVKVTHSTPAWTEKLFRVAGMGIHADSTIGLVLREYADAVYSLDTLNTKDTLPSSNLPDPRTVAAPTGLTLTSSSATALATQDGQSVPRILVEWTAADEPFLRNYEVQYKVTSGGTYEAVPNPTASDELIYISPVTNGTGYTVRIRSVSTIGVPSAWVSDTITAATDESAATGAPSVSISGLDAELFPNFGTAQSFKWVKDETDAPTAGEVRAGAASTTETGVTAHTFTAAGVTVWVGVLLYTDASTTDNESALFVIPVTYGSPVDTALINVIQDADPSGAWDGDDEGRTWVNTTFDNPIWQMWDGTAFITPRFRQTAFTPELDGYIHITNAAGASWNAMRTAASGTAVEDSGSDGQAQISADTNVDKWDNFSRFFAIIDTSRIEGEDAIASATVTVTVSATANADFSGELTLVAFTPADDSSIVTDDFNNFGTTKLSNTLPTLAGKVQNDEIVFTLNATGRAYINKAGNTNLGVLMESDRSDTEPVWGSAEKDTLKMYTLENGSKYMVLAVVYS